MNNLKQIGLARQMYIDDYDGWLVPAVNLDDGTKGWLRNSAFMNYLNLDCPCLKKRSVLTCPSDSDAAIETRYQSGCPHDGRGSYAMNAHLGAGTGYGVPAIYVRARKESEFRYPSRTICVMDYGWDCRVISTNPDYINYPEFPPFHSKGRNVLYLDGHVEWKKELSTDMNDCCWDGD